MPRQKYEFVLPRTKVRIGIIRITSKKLTGSHHHCHSLEQQCDEHISWWEATWRYSSSLCWLFFQLVEKQILPWLWHTITMSRTQRDTKGKCYRTNIVDTKSSSSVLHNTILWKLKAMWGLKNRMVFDSPKVLAWAKPGRGGWVKTKLRCDGLLPIGCRREWNWF